MKDARVARKAVENRARASRSCGHKDRAWRAACGENAGAGTERCVGMSGSRRRKSSSRRRSHGCPESRRTKTHLLLSPIFELSYAASHPNDFLVTIETVGDAGVALYSLAARAIATRARWPAGFRRDDGLSRRARLRRTARACDEQISRAARESCGACFFPPSCCFFSLGPAKLRRSGGFDDRGSGKALVIRSTSQRPVSPSCRVRRDDRQDRRPYRRRGRKSPTPTRSCWPVVRRSARYGPIRP